jgi:hypothetical protein
LKSPDSPAKVTMSASVIVRAGRAQLHADLEVFKIQAFGLIHKLSHVLLIEETEPQITQISQIKECNNL